MIKGKSAFIVKLEHLKKGFLNITNWNKKHAVVLELMQTMVTLKINQTDKAPVLVSSFSKVSPPHCLPGEWRRWSVTQLHPAPQLLDLKFLHQDFTPQSKVIQANMCAILLVCIPAQSHPTPTVQLCLSSYGARRNAIATFGYVLVHKWSSSTMPFPG